MKRLRAVWLSLVVCLAASRLFAQPIAAAAEGWVVLPVDEYRELRQRASPPVTPDALPVEATVTRIDYELRVDADAIAGRALLTIDVVKNGWTRVQIPAGLRANDAHLDGQPVPLIAGPPPHVLLPRNGRFVLALDIVLPLAAAAGTESVTLPPSPSAIARVTLTLPKSGIDLAATGGFVAEHVDVNGESRWTAYGRPNQPLALTWKRKTDDHRAELPLRLRARLTTLATFSEDACATTTAVRVEIVQGLAREIALAVPAGLTINQVSGASVGDWTASGGVLRVRPLDPVAVDAAFVVQAEMRVPREGVIVVPLVRMPSAERETGGVAVEVAGAGEVAGRLARGLDPADPSDLGDVVAGRESPSMLAFRSKPIAGIEERSLSVTVIRYASQAVLVANVEEARYRALASEDGRLLVHARYAVRNNQRSFLKVTLPHDASVWSAEVAGRPVRPGLAEGTAVLLPLEKGRAGVDAPTFAVDLIYAQRIDPWIDKGRARLDLPALDLPTSRTGVEFFYSPRFRVDPQPGAFRAENDPGVFADALRQPSPTPVSAPVASGDAKAVGAMQALVDRYRNESGGRTLSGALPIHVTFPVVGPSIFLGSELTEEGRAPSIELTFKRARS